MLGRNTSEPSVFSISSTNEKGCRSTLLKLSRSREELLAGVELWVSFHTTFSQVNTFVFFFFANPDTHDGFQS